MNQPELNWAAKVANLRATLGREPDLNELLTLARAHRMTAEETAAQRASFVLAEVGFGTDADELAYRRAVEHGDGAEIARLDAEAEARMERVRRMGGYYGS